MPIPLTAVEVLDREFLAARAKLIDVAAILDRIDRAEGDPAGDARLDQIARSLQVLAGETSDRAEQIQSIFSLPYDDQWQAKFDLA